MSDDAPAAEADGNLSEIELVALEEFGFEKEGLGSEVGDETT